MILAGNILNIIAPIVQNVSFLFKSKTKVLFGVLFASVIWIVAYFLMSKIGTAIMTILGVIVPIVNYFTDKIDKKRLWWVYILYVAYIVSITIVFYETPLDIMPSIAVFMLVLSTIPHNQVLFRLTLLCMSLVWLVYGIVLMQFGIIVGNSIQMISLIVEIIYYVVIKSRHKKEQIE